MFCVYILRSLKDNGFYFGHSADAQKRLKEHNALKVRSTKARVPFILHYSESFSTKSEAFQREMFLKSLEGRNFLKQGNII